MRTMCFVRWKTIWLGDSANLSWNPVGYCEHCRDNLRTCRQFRSSVKLRNSLLLLQMAWLMVIEKAGLWASNSVPKLLYNLSCLRACAVKYMLLQGETARTSTGVADSKVEDSVRIPGISVLTNCWSSMPVRCRSITGLRDRILQNVAPRI